MGLGTYLRYSTETLSIAMDEDGEGFGVSLNM